MANHEQHSCSMVYEGFGPVFRMLLNKLGIPQKCVAEATDIGEAIICHYYSGKRNPSETHVYRIGLALGVSREVQNILLQAAGYMTVGRVGKCVRRGEHSCGAAKV